MASPVDLAAVRQRVGATVFARVAGPDGPSHRARIHDGEGPRWFGPDRPIREVHGDASMFVGGLTALLLQSLHPLAMAGVAGHSDYKGDPWGRLQRTSYFLAMTTYGPAAEAERTVAKIRGIHRRVKGTAPDGRPYSASDPHLLEWVQVTEAWSFLRAHKRFGRVDLDQDQRDGYVSDLAVVGRKLGVLDPPVTEQELEERLASFRPELRRTAEAAEAARFLLVRPPLPLAVRPAYGVLAAAAVSLLPGWARRPLRLPRLPVTETALVRPAGEVLVRTIRWAMQPPEVADLDASA
ncbi:oxygenase MpaB family protein [Jatrophihabitans sp. YIM 134969]